MNHPVDPFSDTPEGRALSRWLDGESTSEEAKAVKARLAGDPALATEVERLREDVAVWRDASRVPPPERLAERVLASVASGDVETERFRTVAKRTAIAASALLALGVGGSVWAHGAAASSTASPPPIESLEGLHASYERSLFILRFPALPESRPTEGR